jgi:hypothetical protein
MTPPAWQEVKREDTMSVFYRRRFTDGSFDTVQEQFAALCAATPGCGMMMFKLTVSTTVTDVFLKLPSGHLCVEFEGFEPVSPTCIPSLGCHTLLVGDEIEFRTGIPVDRQHASRAPSPGPERPPPLRHSHRDSRRRR